MLGCLRILGVVTVLSGLCSAAWAQDVPAAPATDMIATLDAVCVTAQGDPQKAASLATEAGFSPVPDSIVPNLRNTSDRKGFMRSNGTVISLVMTGVMTRRLGRETIVMSFCGVNSQPSDHRALDARLREVMGFAPVVGAGLDAYAWLQTPEGRAPARSLSDPQFLSMAQTGQMRLIGLDRSGRGSTLLYLLPRVD